MKAVGSVIVVIATLAVCGLFLYQGYPVAERVVIKSPEYRMVTSTTPRKVVESITIDGKKVNVNVVAYDTVREPVTLTASREIVTQASKEEMLRYWVIVGILGLLGLYAIATFLLWVRDKWSRRETKDTEDTKKRFDDLVKICMTVLLTLLGSAGLTRGIGKPLSPAAPNAYQEFPPGVVGVDDTPPELEPAPHSVKSSPAPVEKKQKEAGPQ